MMASLLGFVIAVIVALTGTGAGSVTAPVLMLCLPITPAVAIGTSLLFTVCIKLPAAVLYSRHGLTDRRALTALCKGGVPGALAGVLGLSLLNARHYDHVIAIVIGVVVVGLALLNACAPKKHGRSALRRERRNWLPWAAAAIGAEVAFSSAGAGALSSLLLLSFTNLTPAQIVGTTLWFGFFTSTLCAVWYFAAGTFSAALLGKLVAGGLVGIVFGAHLSGAIAPGRLRVLLAVVIGGIGLQLCWKSFDPGWISAWLK